jgi:hypothetical protein
MASPPEKSSPIVGDRLIIFAQLAFGAVLVGFGAFLAVIFPDSKEIGTLVIGAGAAMLPTGAAAAASSRIPRPAAASTHKSTTDV